MSAASVQRSLTLSALYSDASAAERAAERLCAAGVPEGSIEFRREVVSRDEGDRFLGGIEEFLMPAADLDALNSGIERGGTVIVVHDTPPDLSGTALDILDEEAVDLDQTLERTSDYDPQGAIGTPGGAGRATQTYDRLTGQRVGPPPGEPAAETEEGARQARRLRRDASTSHRRARAYVPQD
jgi:hypothetical protein